MLIDNKKLIALSKKIFKVCEDAKLTPAEVKFLLEYCLDKFKEGMMNFEIRKVFEEIQRQIAKEQKERNGKYLG